MAIPLPNPNINDFDTNDVQTWSSNKLKGGFLAVGGSIGSDGSIVAKQPTKLATVTLDSAVTEYDVIFDSPVKDVIVLVGVTFSSTASYVFTLKAKTVESSDTFIGTSAYCTRSFTADTAYIVKLHADCIKGLLDGEGFASVPNSYGNVMTSLPSDYVTNIITSGINSIKVTCSTSMPIGTTIDIFTV